MTELSNKVIALLEDAIETSLLLKVESVVFDNHSLRGENKERGTFFVMAFPENTEWEFGAMGITRVGELAKRIALISGLGNDFTIVPEYKERDGGDKFVFRMVLKHKKTKVDFKCADPTKIKAPKAFMDPEHFEFTIKKTDISFIKQAKSVMGSEFIKFVNVEGSDEITASLSGSEGDIMTHVIKSNLDNKTETEGFNVIFKSDILLPALAAIEKKMDKDGEITIILTRRGIMKLVVEGITAHILPEA